jgi:phosphatidylserine/phosphatidylglycerophosphate/cardiolipin synthase-like enzyme
MHCLEDGVNQPDMSADLSVRFLAEGEQPSATIATLLADFLRGARRSLDIAIYDFRLSEPIRQIVANAFADAAAAGVTIRIAYDADKPETPDLVAAWILRRSALAVSCSHLVIPGGASAA